MSEVENNGEDNEAETPKKTKILTLLLPETHSAENKEAKDSKKEKIKPPTKVVIRRLPPKLNRDSFIEEFSPLPDHDYLCFVRADLSLGANAFSRAYINFVRQEDIFRFREKYDDHVLKDDKGKEYHAVVEFAPFQRIPRKTTQKKKILKAGTLDEDAKYIEFLQKLEDIKNNTSNTSEYFHETDVGTMKEKITTTPLLEFLKQKRQKKIDIRNELRQKKRELEKERRRKEDEKRKLERDRRAKEDKEKKSNKMEERGKDEEKRGIKGKEKLKRRTERKDSETDVADITNDPAVLKVVVGESEATGTAMKRSTSGEKNIKSSDGEAKTEKKILDSKSRISEEKHKKLYQKRDVVEAKIQKPGYVKRGTPDEKSNSNYISTEKNREGDLKKTPEGPVVPEAKSKFRYSEQRNRDREFRNQKSSETKSQKPRLSKEEDDQNKQSNEKGKGDVPIKPEIGKEVARRKSLDLEREATECERKRSKSFHDETSDGPSIELRRGKKGARHHQRVYDTDDSVNGDEGFKNDEDYKKDPRIERRIRNKDRPSIEIYRPGMGKFSKQRIDPKKDDPANSASPQNAKTNSRSTKTPKKSLQPADATSGKSEVRTMTFTRSFGKE